MTKSNIFALSLLTFQTQSMAQTNSIASIADSVSGAQSSSPSPPSAKPPTIPRLPHP